MRVGSLFSAALGLVGLTCSSALTADGYVSSMPLFEDFGGSFQWSLAKVDGVCKLSFKIRVQGDRWVSVGLGTEMMNSNVLIASKKKDGSNVKEYVIGGEQTSSAITLAAQQTLSDVKWEYAGGFTELTVNSVTSIAGKALTLDCSSTGSRRRLSAGDDVIFAIGKEDGDFTQHVADLEANIDWASGTFEVHKEWDHEIHVFPDYEGDFYWKLAEYNGVCQLAFKFKVKGDRWVSVGLGTEMKNSNVLIASKIKHATEVKEYLIGNEESASAISLHSQQTVSNFKWELEDGYTELYVYNLTSIAGKALTLDCSAAGSRRLSETVGDAMIFAIGKEDNDFTQHVADAETTIDWVAGTSEVHKEWDHEIHVFPDYEGDFYWKLAEYNGVCQLAFKFKVKGDRWVSVGLGTEMKNSNVLIASKIKHATAVKEYLIGNEESASAISLHSQQTVSNFKWELEDGYTELYVYNLTSIAGKALTLDCSATGSRRLSASGSAAGEAMIFAIGKEDNEFTQHVADKELSIDLVQGTETGDSTYKGEMSMFPDQDGKFQWKTELYEGKCVVSFKFKVEGDRWVSVGLGTEMKNSNVLIASKAKHGTEVKEYVIGDSESSSAISLHSEQTLGSNVEWKFENGYTEVYVNKITHIAGKEFSAGCGAAGRRLSQSTASGMDPMIFAIGGDNSNFDKHLHDLKATIDWSQSFVSGTQEMNGLVNAHAFLMTIAMGLLLPMSIFSGMTKHKEWFNVHRGLLSLVLLFVVLGFAFAVSEVENHLSEPHYVVGFVVFILMMVNPIIAIVRPEKSAANRVIWVNIHRFFAFCAVILGFYNIYSGAHLVEHSPEFFGDNSEGGAIAFIVIGCLILVAGGAWRLKMELSGEMAPPKAAHKPRESESQTFEAQGTFNSSSNTATDGAPVQAEEESVKIQLN